MSVIDDYLQGLEAPQRTELERVRAIVKGLAPDVEEVIGYGIPTFKYKGKNLLHFAAYTDHLSVFPGPPAIEAVKSELTDFKLSKGTIQFTLEKSIPETTLKKIIQHRLDSIDAKV